MQIAVPYRCGYILYCTGVDMKMEKKGYICYNPFV